LPKRKLSKIIEQSKDAVSMRFEVLGVYPLSHNFGKSMEFMMNMTLKRIKTTTKRFLL